MHVLYTSLWSTERSMGTRTGTRVRPHAALARGKNSCVCLHTSAVRARPARWRGCKLSEPSC